MASLVAVGHDPFVPGLTPVENGPFAANLVPVDYDPFDRAAYRMRQATQPAGGRQEGVASRVMTNLLPVLGREVVAPLARLVAQTVAYPGQVLSGQVDYDWGGPVSQANARSAAALMASPSPAMGTGRAIASIAAERPAQPTLPQAAVDAGHDVLAYHGTPGFVGTAIDPAYNTSPFGGFFTTPEQRLAQIYAGKRGEVMPIALRTKDYHVVDAKGASWEDIEQTAIRQAAEMGKPGVRIDNMMSEPESRKPLGTPQTVYATLDPTTARPVSTFGPRLVPVDRDPFQ